MTASLVPTETSRFWVALVEEVCVCVRVTSVLTVEEDRKLMALVTLLVVVLVQSPIPNMHTMTLAITGQKNVGGSDLRSDRRECDTGVRKACTPPIMSWGSWRTPRRRSEL